VEGIGKTVVIREIREVNIADNADDLVEEFVDVLDSGFGIALPPEAREALEQLVEHKAEELREEIVDMVERIQL